MPDYGNNGPKVANNEWNGLQPVHFCDGIPYANFFTLQTNFVKINVRYAA